MLLRTSSLALLLVAAACQPSDTIDVGGDEFLSRISQYCGAAYEGTIVSNDPEDDAWRGETIIVDFMMCTETGAQLPLHVGDDHSRIWLLALGDDGRVALRHRHTHEDGTADAVTMYGGQSAESSTAMRQEFPANDQTKRLFEEEGLQVSTQNVWAMEIKPDQDLLAYELQRPERFFRIEFDLSSPVEAPADPW